MSFIERKNVAAENNSSFIEKDAMEVISTLTVLSDAEIQSYSRDQLEAKAQEVVFAQTIVENYLRDLAVKFDPNHVVELTDDKDFPSHVTVESNFEDFTEAKKKLSEIASKIELRLVELAGRTNYRVA